MRKGTGGAIYRMMVQTLPGVIQPLRILWNQLIGFIFVVLAAGAAPQLVKNVRHFTGDSDNVFRIVLSGIFIGVMLFFAISSFLRARRVERS